MQHWPNITRYTDVRLAGCTTLRLGGPARVFHEARSAQEVIDAVRGAEAAGEPVLILGGGSNLVVADEGFPGAVVRVATSGTDIRRDPEDGRAAVLRVAAGEDWDALVARCVTEGLAGVECLAGIPGLVGATPIQNVGAYGQEVAETITSVRAFDRRAGWWSSAPPRAGSGTGPACSSAGPAASCCSRSPSVFIQNGCRGQSAIR